MADTMTIAGSTRWYLPPRTAQDYCREMWYFLQRSPDAWCQGVSARTGDGSPCVATSPHARAYCMIGLIEHFIHDEPMRERVIDLLMRAISPDFGVPVHVYNDKSGRTVAEMIALLDAASQLVNSPAPMNRDQYLASAAAYAKKTVYSPSWLQQLGSLNEASVEQLEKEMQKSMSKLVPWPTIMEQIDRAAA